MSKPLDYTQVEPDPRKADLVGGFVPQVQLPSYVDDILEFPALANFPVTGESGKIYVAISPKNLQYRWSGSAYIAITNGFIASTDDVPEGVNNKYSKQTLVLSYLLSGLSTATNSAISATDSILVALGKLQAQVNAKQNTLSIASDAEMQTGTDNTKYTTALRIATWWNWIKTRPLTLGSLAGVGNRVVQANSAGDVSAPYTIQDGFVSDSDVITALTTATYNSGNNFTAVVTPANSKVFNQGQFYKNAGVLYFATADNISSRITLS